MSRRNAIPWGVVESAGGLPAQRVVGSMGDNKQPKATAHSPDQEEAEELRRILQSDDVAPVDYASYGSAASGADVGLRVCHSCGTRED
jgi:hypothetical protein